MFRVRVRSVSTWDDWRHAASVTPAHLFRYSSALSGDFGPSVQLTLEPAQLHLCGPTPTGPSAPHPGPLPPWTVSGAATGSRRWRCSPSRPSCSSSRPDATVRKGPPSRRTVEQWVQYPSRETRGKVAYTRFDSVEQDVRGSAHYDLLSLILDWHISKQKPNRRAAQTDCITTPVDTCHSETLPVTCSDSLILL